MPSNDIYGAGATPLVPTNALWQWDTTGGTPVVSGYPTGYGTFGPTKSGLLPQDLKDFVGVPLQTYGNPPVAVTDETILKWIRWGEDSVEQQTSILLCQTWVASPPAFRRDVAASIGIIPAPVNGVELGYQQRGTSYDLEDAAYDFMFKNAQDEGWMIQQLRYRPVQSNNYDPMDATAIKNVAYVYPLLNTFFRIPPTWFVEDKDYGLVRFVPAENVQMLPLFAMQLAFMGFAENVPGAIWFQYTAGLTPYDYKARYSFMQELVLTMAAIRALSAVQGTINLGMKSISTTVDGLQQKFEYDVKGPYAGLIDGFKLSRDELMTQAKNFVSGPMMTMI